MCPEPYSKTRKGTVVVLVVKGRIRAALALLAAGVCCALLSPVQAGAVKWTFRALHPPEGQQSGEGEGGSQQGSENGWNALAEPINPAFQYATPFGTRSFWVQPWRAYFTTRPASALTEGLGVNFNARSAQMEPVAQALQEVGFKLARIGINWGAMSYEEPSKFSNETTIRARLEALHRHGLRPLIVLDANSLSPTPSVPVTLTTLAAAPAGATTVKLSHASAALVVPGKTGFDHLRFGGNPDILVTSVTTAGVASLSAPLPAALAAGEHEGTTLRYAPFGSRRLANGKPNPVFAETLGGWLKYVAAVNRVASSVVGAGNYDLEVWNELSFGSQFLRAEAYYRPGGASEESVRATEEEAGETAASGEALEQGAEHALEEAAEGSEAEESGPEVSTTRLLLEETVRYVRSPANGIPASVGITNGFASQTPFPSGANAPAGLTALSKHPYAGWHEYPARLTTSPQRNVNADGTIEGGGPKRLPAYAPTFDALFPEYFLTALSTEYLVRDVSPLTTQVYGMPHGANVGPAGGPPVQKWITEYGQIPGGKSTPVAPNGVTKLPNVTISRRDHEHFLTKVLLRSLTAMINKGFSREYFYAAANAGNFAIVGSEFTSSLKSQPGKYPGLAAAGEQDIALQNLISQFAGPGPAGAPRQLQLTNIEQFGDHAQFAGDGTSKHAPLFDREVFAVLPFQNGPESFVIPYYVMTRNLLTDYRPEAPESDVSRFDLPDEAFRIGLANLPSGTAHVSAYDPVTGQSTPCKVLSSTGASLSVEVQATDYPRLLRISY